MALRTRALFATFFLAGLTMALPAHAQWRRRRRGWNNRSFYSQQTEYNPHPFGLGIMVGEPTGITGKYRMSMDTAIDGGLAYSFADNQAHMQLQADYLRIMPNKLHINNRVALDFYFGGGAQLRTGDDTEFGIRIPVGLAYNFGDTKQLEAFGEVAPGLNLVSSTTLIFGIDIGVRYYF